MQVYFAGHDHNLEHIHPPGGLPHYVISGGGSKCDRPFIGDADSLFQWQNSGRASLHPHQSFLSAAGLAGSCHAYSDDHAMFLRHLNMIIRSVYDQL